MVLRIDLNKCQGQACGRLCESIIDNFLFRQPITINKWSMREHGKNYQKIMHVIEYCPHQAAYLENKE